MAKNIKELADETLKWSENGPIKAILCNGVGNFRTKFLLFLGSLEVFSQGIRNIDTVLTATTSQDVQLAAGILLLHTIEGIQKREKEKIMAFIKKSEDTFHAENFSAIRHKIIKQGMTLEGVVSLFAEVRAKALRLQSVFSDFTLGNLPEIEHIANTPTNINITN